MARGPALTGSGLRRRRRPGIGAGRAAPRGWLRRPIRARPGHLGGGLGHAARRRQVAALLRRAMAVLRTLAATMGRHQANGPVGAAILVDRALHTVVLGRARRAGGLAMLARVALDARARGSITDAPAGVVAAVGARTRLTATVAFDVAGASAAIGIRHALDAAVVYRIAGATAALARVDALDAAAAAGAGWRARFTAVLVAQALHAEIELARTAAHGLPGAVARSVARERAGEEHGIAALSARAIARAAAFDAHVADAGGFAAAAVVVDEALATRARCAERSVARTLGRAATLCVESARVAEELECAAFVQAATPHTEAEREPAECRAQRRPRAPRPHGAAGAGSASRRSASARANPFGCCAR
jgi:hypothetical protein